MSIKPRSRKAKGRRLQNELVQLLLKYFPELTEDDVRGAIMGESGEDIKLSARAKELIPFSLEAKYQEQLSIWSALGQAAKNAKGRIPALVFRRNRSKTYIVFEIEDFFKLWKS
jgi:hypothetical protein